MNTTTPRFTIAEDGKSITCHACNRTSYSLEDVKQHYCGHCLKFHDAPTDEEMTALLAWKERVGNPPVPMLAHFDPNDETAIKEAWDRCFANYVAGEIGVRGAFKTTALQEHIADCVAYAVRQFHQRLAIRRPLWEVKDGEWFFKICQPRTFFDSFVVRLVMQDISTSTERGVALGRCQPGPDAGPEFGRCPDVLFEPR